MDDNGLLCENMLTSNDVPLKVLWYTLLNLLIYEFDIVVEVGMKISFVKFTLIFIHT